ncbi:Kinesin-like protein KIF26A-like [Homarus americanus]|uniref:Kinesin-like protein KIF26A-like n=1 Tax=Homarus americanus TaxID=6706 RepID=A0A8J5JQB7_HOMAM|nr:Kinesin-like protein KIF26A-like [Homarus americanus]
MIDMGDLSGSSGGMSLSALTSVLLAIFNGQRYLPNRENKLTMLLKEALGSVTCHAAMVVHISPSPRHAQHTLATLQLASRVHRMRRKKLRGLGGSSSGGSSEGSHSRSSGGDTSAGSSSMDFSSSEQSCDTVIYIGGGGPGDTTDNEHPPVFMPHHTNQRLWPITRLRSMEHLRPHSASPTPAHSRRAASASPTPTSRSVPNGRSQLKPRPPPRTVSNVSSPASSGKVSPGGGFIRHQPGVSRVAYNSTSGQQPLLSSFKPQVTLGPLVPGYGFMDDHKKTMIERWVEVQTAQVVQQLEQQQTVPAQIPNQTTTNQQQFTHLTQFRTCEESTLDSDQDTLSEDPPSGPGRPPGLDAALPPQPNLIEELERKNLIPTENSEAIPDPTPSETEVQSKDLTLDEKSSEPRCSPDEVSGADEPSIDDICSQCEALAEECEELSSLLSCEEEECKRQAHLGLATVLEEPELEAAITAADLHKEEQEQEYETGHEVDEEMSTTPRRGWVRRSLASSGTHHSTELIEVQVPDYPVVTVDCCIQVCEEDIVRALSDTPCQSEVMSVETSDDHPLRVLSEENLTCASTFTDSYSQMGETGDEDDSDDDDSRPFSLFEVTDYGRVCQDLSLALQSDVANRNLHELAKIHDLYRTLARQSPRVHTGGSRLQAATLAEILTNSHDSLLEDQKPPLEDDSICSEPAHADEKLCRHCNKKQLRHGDSILKLESAFRSKSQWLSRHLETLEDSASDKCIGTDDLDFPDEHCTCDVQSDLVPYIPSMFFNFSSVHNPDDASDSNLTRQASEASLHLKDAPLADSTEKLTDRVPINGVSLPEFIEDVEANVVLCNPVQYDYSKDEDVIDINDERTVTGKSDNESDCVSNISEDSEYMMQTSKLSKFLCVGVGRSKSKTPYKVAKQNNNKIVENKKNMAKIKESKVKNPAKGRENSKSPDRNSKNLIKSPSRVVSQSAAKQSVSRRGDNASVRTRWGKSARVGAAKPPAVGTRGNYRYTCTLMYPPDAPTPTEGYDSGHDSGAATQGSATPLENNEAWRTTQNLQPHQHHHHHQHHHPAANSGSLGTNPSLGESSGYESIPRDSECSSFSSSQDSEMDDEHRRDAQAHSQAFLHPQTPPKPQVVNASSKVQVEEWSEEDVKRYEGRPSAAEIPQMRASRQQILSLKSAQRSLKVDLAQAKGNLNVPSDSWSYELHVKEDSPLDHRTFVEALARETVILQKRVAAARSRVLIVTAFLPKERLETLIN